ncbi:MAG: NTP transferase domain-containing protein [Thalassobaculales bacterium]
MTTAAIVQARLGSSRLPGKVLMRLGGVTVLRHVLGRAAAIPGIDRLVCAVPERAADDLVAAEARAAGAEVVRGPEADVLARYALAAAASRADRLLRITADCPLLDPLLCGEVLALLGGHDYASNVEPRRFPQGLDCEAMTAEALHRAAAEATEPYEREHVTPWLRRHPTIRRAHLVPAEDLSVHRWTLDTPADFAFLEALWPRLSGTGWRQVLAVLA